MSSTKSMSQANTLASFSATVSEISAASAAANSDESMVAVAVRIRVCTGFSIIFPAHDLESLGFADLAREFLDLAVAMRELDRVARFEEIQALADARQVTNRG